MRTARLETVCASVSVATVRCHSGGSQMNKFEKVSSDDHQMSLAGMAGGRGPRSDVQGVGAQYSEVQYIMGNSDIHGTPHDRIIDGRTQLRTLLPVTSYFLEILDLPLRRVPLQTYEELI